MSKGKETFFTVIGCMDGRAQEPIRRFGQRRFNAEYPDTITEAGLVGRLANNPAQELLDGVKKKMEISIEHHKSKGVVVFGHQECAGNPVEDDQHRDDVRKSIVVVQTVFPKSLRIVGAFVKLGKRGWKVEELVV